jgi:hypothetical protein
MPDTQFPHLHLTATKNISRGRERKASQKWEFQADTKNNIRDFVLHPTLKYFIETLKSFMVEDLKLVLFSPKEHFCMHQHEEDEVECGIYI